MIDRHSRLNQLDLFLPTLPRPITPKYQLTVDGSTYYWTGLGRLPAVFDTYIYETNAHKLSNEVLKELLISGVNHG